MASVALNLARVTTNYGVRAAAHTGTALLKHPKITALAIGILALSNVPVADGGPITGVACFISCMGGGMVALKGALIPATVAVCTRLCAFVTAAPFLP